MDVKTWNSMKYSGMTILLPQGAVLRSIEDDSVVVAGEGLVDPSLLQTLGTGQLPQHTPGTLYRGSPERQRVGQGNCSH